MSKKTIIRGILVIFVLASVVGIFIKESSNNKPPELTKRQTQNNTVQIKNKTIVYYFHGNVRCPTCRKMEALGRKALEDNFAKQLKAGSLVFKEVNVEQGFNEHFVADYQLQSKTIVLSQIQNNKETRHYKLDKLWDMISDDAKYMQYITNELNNFLKSKK